MHVNKKLMARHELFLIIYFIHEIKRLKPLRLCYFALKTKKTWWTASSETQGQLVGLGERARRKFSRMGERAPGYRLSTNYFQKFRRTPAPDWVQKMVCIIAPNRRTVSPKFFSWVRTRRLLFRSLLVWLMHQTATKELHAVRKLSVWYKIPIWFQNTVCPKTKDAFPKLQQVFTLERSRLA